MKMNIVLDEKGGLVAAQRIDSGAKDAGLIAGPGQKLQSVDVPDHVATLTDPQKFVTQIMPLLAKP